MERTQISILLKHAQICTSDLHLKMFHKLARCYRNLEGKFFRVKQYGRKNNNFYFIEKKKKKKKKKKEKAQIKKKILFFFKKKKKKKKKKRSKAKMQIEVMDPVLVSLNDQRLVNQPSVYSSFVQRLLFKSCSRKTSKVSLHYDLLTATRCVNDNPGLQDQIFSYEYAK